MEHKDINPNEQLIKLLRNYIPNTRGSNGIFPEFEIRFGTRGARTTKIQYDNVIRYLLARGFRQNFARTMERLDIRTQFQSDKDGARESSVRVELHGAPNIQEYCRTNLITEKQAKTMTATKNIDFVQKMPIDVDGERLVDAQFHDFNMTVSYKNEKTHVIGKSALVDGLISEWVNLKKSFRLINRVQFESPVEHLIVHLSVVRTSTVSSGNGKRPETEYFYNIADSNVFNNSASYEIEAEFYNEYAGKSTVPLLTQMVYRVSKYVMCGLQNTNYPISLSEKKAVLDEYAELLYPGKNFPRMYSGNFIGPSSVTLQRPNLLPPSTTSKEPNVLTAYAVTDKADGERHLLFITKTGGIYLINTSMDVVSTGTHTANKAHFNTIIDGELIRTDKQGAWINRFAAFDLYYVSGKSVRHFPLMLSGEKESSSTRLVLLNALVGNLVQEPNLGVSSSYVSITVKTFLNSGNVFNDCRKILNDSADYEYSIDGLILTHRTLGVGSDEQGKAGPLRLTTWKYSFKWKPAEYNTIDFLISTQKDSNGRDIVSSTFVDRQAATFYKTLVLKCGYNEKDHGFINPVMDVINDVRYSDDSETKAYRPEQFMPYDPSNPMAGLCHMPFAEENTKMATIEGDIIEDDTIVEFMFNKEMYDAGALVQQCWIPIRNRYDKTEKYKRGESIFGNAYHTANSNWHSIHYPVSREMVSGTVPIPVLDVSEDVYYNNASKRSKTEGLRNFHNAFVKKTLISAVSRPGNSLIDYGCGKGGDFPKWISRELSFVLGVDYSKDNIENRFDGAYARYITHGRRHLKMPNALFVQGDCAKNIRNGDAIIGDINKEIIRSVFGQGEEAQFEDHPGILRAFKAGANGFNVSSCQFAMHYFFKDVSSLHNFLRNVSECTEMNGYFIGTCYDGRTIMQELRRYAYDDGMRMYESQQLICEIIKQYDNEDFFDDESCLGKQILVFQDSINQYVPEYLVNFNYLVRVIDMYGFELVRHNEYSRMDLPDSTGMFDTLFRKMRTSPSSEYADALNMTESEKFISFLNRYFIFRKVRDINAETVAKAFIQPVEIDTTVLPRERLPEEEVEVVKPLHRTIVLKSSNEEIEAPKPSVRTKKITEKSAPKRTSKKNVPPPPEEKEEGEVSLSDEVPVIVPDVVIPEVIAAPKKKRATKKEEDSNAEVKPKRKYTKKVQFETPGDK